MSCAIEMHKEDGKRQPVVMEDLHAQTLGEVYKGTALFRVQFRFHLRSRELYTADSPPVAQSPWHPIELPEADTLYTVTFELSDEGMQALEKAAGTSL